MVLWAGVLVGLFCRRIDSGSGEGDLGDPVLALPCGEA